MKRGRFTEEQIIAVLREHEAGAKTGELVRKHGISGATLYNHVIVCATPTDMPQLAPARIKPYRQLHLQ